ncbi:hypothetical protein PSCICO_44080 [Pseudomonas cichorii]|uniref:chitin synthase n=1 Tax=Pseudomonas cichorii TaxID=36746 RepID=A0A3M4WA40_PSECI|nr:MULTISPECIES: glycosyltransferase [Pseudomonas]AHF66777.1 hypothetical protein PCH70_16240 [Pseudomonas cichorii JBC1]QVE18678.1 glycosyltransferase [Pseudomonas cichorii]RMR60092.1 hypothetical protein ALP84_01363 [Pseudomonas cichorii]SDO03941.1 Chitin synthase [Pseudomonas cichorii]GFM74369.1 hypothetical protein PSCICM_01880 [Pseudomonas cichorii]
MQLTAVEPQHNEEVERWKRHFQRKTFCSQNTIIAGELPTTDADILVCLTLYNEQAQAVADTLAGVARNQIQLARYMAAPVPRIVVCIVLDGMHCVDASTTLLLESLGLSPRRQPMDEALAEAENRIILQGKNLPANELLERCGKDWVGEQSSASITVLLATKLHNASKLDSHAWFFWGIGSKVKARFAMQLDAGSIPAPDCFKHLLQHMHDEPECGAVTTCILTPVPENMNLQQNWQYADYLWEKVSDWPVGNLCRYLEVVPGQCSLIRWESFCEPESQERAPIDEYLRGLEPQGLLECNLFLAEDRVMGFELVKNLQHSSTVRYCPQAQVETDLCPDFGELIRQRRRWINSTVAARLSSAKQLPKMMKQHSISTQRIPGVLLSLCWGLMQFATQLMMPVFITVLMATGVAYTSTKIGTAAHVAESNGYWAATGFLLLWASVLLISRQINIGSRRGERWHITAICTLGIVMVSGWALTLWGSTLQSLYFIGATLLFVIIAIVAQSWGHLRQVGRWFGLYLVLLPVFNLYMTSYSLANISDISWGTKGLVSKHAAPDRARRWSRTRDQLLWIWILSSVALSSLILLAVPMSSWMVCVQLLSLFFVRIGIAAFISVCTQAYDAVRQRT